MNKKLGVIALVAAVLTTAFAATASAEECGPGGERAAYQVPMAGNGFEGRQEHRFERRERRRHRRHERRWSRFHRATPLYR